MRLALLLLAACGSGPLHLMPAPEVYEHTAAAVEAINEAAGAKLVTIGAEPGATVYVLPTGRCGTHEPGTIRAGQCGSDPESPPIVIIHEIGHELGLRHSPDPASIMFERYHPMTLADAARSLVEELRR
jgi:hypothetical protein